MVTDRVLVCLALFLLVCACGDADSLASDSDLAGTDGSPLESKIVENAGSGAWGADDAWRLEEVMAAGTGSGSERPFGDVSGLDVDEAGNVYVADKLAQEIRVFDGAGNPLRTIGRAGSGPGEFGGNIGGVFVIGQELIVPDVANQRVSRFALSGTFIDSRRVSAEAGVPIRWDVADGRLVAQRRRVVPGDRDVVEGDRIVSLTPPEDTLVLLPPGQAVQITGEGPIIRQFHPEPVWDSTYDGRLVIAMTDEWRFVVRDAGGRVEWVATRPMETARTSSADRDAVRTSLREMYTRQGIPAAAREAVIDRMEFADRLPALTSVIFGPNDSLWVRHFVAPSTSERGRTRVLVEEMGSTDWSVFDATGHYLGDVSFPTDFTPVQVVDDRFYGVVFNEHDVQSVRSYRVVTE